MSIWAIFQTSDFSWSSIEMYNHIRRIGVFNKIYSLLKFNWHKSDSHKWSSKSSISIISHVFVEIVQKITCWGTGDGGWGCWKDLRRHCFVKIQYFVIMFNTAWKVSKYWVISGPYFLVFGLNTKIYGALRSVTLYIAMEII